MALLRDYSVLSLEEAYDVLDAEAGGNDVWVTRMLNSISLRLEVFCRRKLRQQTLTSFRIDGNGKSEFRLPYTPVQSVSKIVIHDLVDDSTVETISDTSIISVVNKRRGLVRLHEDVLPLGKSNVAVTFSCGYTTADQELDVVQEAALIQLKYEYTRWKKNEYGVSSQTDRDGNVSVIEAETALLPEVQSRLRMSSLVVAKF